MVNCKAMNNFVANNFATALDQTEKAASVRYVRALKRLHHKLAEVLCFRKSQRWAYSK